jgi:hypothetical protein
VFETGGAEEAYIWEALDHSVERPVLVLYPLKDTAFLAGTELSSEWTCFQIKPLEH